MSGEQRSCTAQCMQDNVQRIHLWHSGRWSTSAVHAYLRRMFCVVLQLLRVLSSIQHKGRGCATAGVQRHTSSTSRRPL